MTITKERPLMTPARLRTRAELAELHGVSVRTLDRLWAARATNGHPAPANPGETPARWNAAQYGRWYRSLAAGTGTGTATPKARPVPDSGDPDELITGSEFARLLGLKSAAWVSRAAAADTPPPHFPAPADWGDPVSRTYPKWRRRDAVGYAKKRPTIAHARPGRPAGSTTKTRPYEGDARLAVARQALADHPGEPASATAARLAAAHGGSDRTWARVIAAAQQNDTEAGG